MAISADYAKGLYEVYENAMVLYAKNCKKLQLLSTIDNPQRQFPWTGKLGAKLVSENGSKAP